MFKLNVRKLCIITSHELSCSGIDLRQEVEEVTSRLKFLSEAHQTVRDDIALTRRTTEKTSADMTRAEEDKLNQAS